MEDNIYVPQKNKKLANCETAYIFKGLGLNLIPYSPSTTQLQKIKNYLKEDLLKNGKDYSDKAINKVIEKTPRIGLDISLMQRKFIEVLTIVVGNSTLMDTLQRNNFYRRKGWDNKIVQFSYNNLIFQVPIKDINKLFGRSIKEKRGKYKKNFVEQLSNKRCFLINSKGKICFTRPVFMEIKENYLRFSFSSFLIGRTYDKRKNFFDNIQTNYEAIFFENLFKMTKDYKKKVQETWYFTTRSLLKNLGMVDYAKTHKQKVIEILNKCFEKGKEIGIFIEDFKYTKDNFKQNDTTQFNIQINKDFKWY